MTERKPLGSGYETWIERQIREAEERGEFDNLPGAGQPLPNLGGPDDEMWWIKQKLEREGLSTDAVLPTPLRLRKEIERLPETVHDLPSEDDVRAVVTELNARIMQHLRAPSGPQIPVSMVQADKVVAQWRAANSPVGREQTAATADGPGAADAAADRAGAADAAADRAGAADAAADRAGAVRAADGSGAVRAADGSGAVRAADGSGAADAAADRASSAQAPATPAGPRRRRWWARLAAHFNSARWR